MALSSKLSSISKVRLGSQVVLASSSFRVSFRFFLSTRYWYFVREFLAMSLRFTCSSVGIIWLDKPVDLIHTT